MSLHAGLVTLLFTDIEGGARLWETDREAMAAASARNEHIVREQVEACDGLVFKAVADAHRAVFADPVAALLSAMAIQRAVAAEPWAPSPPVRVRIALHSGACAERDGDYVGPVVNRVARLPDVGHGGHLRQQRLGGRRRGRQRQGHHADPALEWQDVEPSIQPHG
jgi:class 3 adenylate cyclase